MSQRPEVPGSRRLKRAASRSTGGSAYEGAFEAVGSILISTGLGYWFDQSQGTTPVGLLVGASIGFAAFVLRLVRLGKTLQAEQAEQAAEQGEQAEQPPADADAEVRTDASESDSAEESDEIRMMGETPGLVAALRETDDETDDEEETRRAKSDHEA
ncbi:MAG TPA: AtpZ/AtpI family protein [Myxococcota bacterium]|nr:AtpZ/AtpI family protein [Myxococcota bacterium]